MLSFLLYWIFWSGLGAGGLCGFECALLMQLNVIMVLFGKHLWLSSAVCFVGCYYLFLFVFWCYGVARRLAPVVCGVCERFWHVGWASFTHLAR